MYERKTQKEILCPLEYGLDIFCGKWKSRIICILSFEGTLRYKEIRERLQPGITDAVLSPILKELFRNDILARRQYDEMPPRVEYKLTEKGVSIIPVLHHICSWSGKHAQLSGTPLPYCKNCPHISHS